MHHRSGRGFLIPALLLAAARAAEAAAPVQVAFSEKLGAEVFANPDASGQWCRETVSLSLLLKDNSPLLQAGLADFVTRVGATLPPKCAEAAHARVAVYSQDRKLVDAPYTIAKSDNWAAPRSVGQSSESPRLAPAPVPVPTPAPSSPPEPTPSPSAVYVPSDLDPFNTIFVAKVAETPALLDDDTVQRYWAQVRFPREYNPVASQEFKVQPVLAKTRADLQETIASMPAGRVTLLVNAQLGAYDFQHSAFPIAGLGGQVSFGKPIWGPMNLLGNAVQVALPELPALAALPMDQKEAETYLAHHTHWGAVDRGVVIAVSVSYRPGSEKLESFATKVDGQIDMAWVLDAGKPIYTFGPTQLAAMQRDLQVREKAVKIAALAQQREQSVALLSRLPAEARLANFISAAPTVDPLARLDDLASARGRALLSQKPVAVRMLVQAASGGGERVDTRWPGHLRLTVSQGAPALERGSWYLVEGTLALDGAAEDLKPAELTVKTLVACKQDLCAEAQDPGAIVDRKIAALGTL